MVARRRILFVVHSPVVGGAAQTMLALCDAVATTHDVALLWSGARFDVGRQVRCRGPIFELELGHYSKTHPLRYCRLLRGYREIVNSFRPDLVVNRGFMSARALGWPSRVLGIGSVAYLADVWPLTPFTRLMLRGNHLVVGVSRSTVEPIRARRRRAVVPPGFPLESVPPKTSRRRTADGKLRIGSVGELVPWKGHRYLIEALRLLGDLRHRVELVIVGSDRLEPGYRAVLEEVARSAGVASSVHFAGFQEAVWPWYEGFDVFVHPTEANEAFGRVLAEAGLTGLPLIGTRTGGIPEIIEDGVSGFVVPPGDSLALAQAMARLIADDALRTGMGAKAEALARERYDIRVTAGRFEALFDALARRDWKALDELCF